MKSILFASSFNQLIGKIDALDLTVSDLKKWSGSFHPALPENLLFRKTQDKNFGDIRPYFTLKWSSISKAIIHAFEVIEPFSNIKRNAREIASRNSSAEKHKISKVIKWCFHDVKIFVMGLYSSNFSQLLSNGISETKRPSQKDSDLHNLYFRECSPEHDISFLKIPVAEYKN